MIIVTVFRKCLLDFPKIFSAAKFFSQLKCEIMAYDGFHGSVFSVFQN